MSQVVLTLKKRDGIDPDLETVLFNAINREAEIIQGLRIIPFSLRLEDEEHNLWGGLTAFLFFGMLHIDQLWVDEERRETGWGTRLVHTAEEHAKKNGCVYATLHTMNWQALPFYQQLGYAIEFKRDGYPKNSSLYLLRKSL